ncbi:hypothetical protein MHYP_G00044740 [Metynnis hypsauchen]
MQDLVSQGILRESCSPWASPAVIVIKKDGSVRFCCDYRRLNQVTCKDAYPLPRVEDSLDALGGAQLFSTLDLMAVYFQGIQVDEEKVLALETWPVPKNVREVRQVLGFMSYYRRFVPGFAHIA